MYKLLVCFGTRPEAIKMAPVVHALKKISGVKTLVCVTAQHREMLDQVLSIFRILPDYDLNLMTPGQTLAGITLAALKEMDRLLKELRPDRIIVHGDTTTSFVCALAAFYHQIPVGHVEAGLRTDNLAAPYPEEFNRITVDSIADYLWAPTRTAFERLAGSCRKDQKVVLTGNTVIDALRITTRTIDESPDLRSALEKFFGWRDPRKKLVLVTGHRRENFDGGLENICEAVSEIAARPDVQVLWPVHPNPNVRAPVYSRLQNISTIHLSDPLDYVFFVEAMRRSHLIVTDSGGIQEEAPFLGRPVLVTRAVTERPEAVEAGTAKLVGADRAKLVQEATRILADDRELESLRPHKTLFGDGEASQRIVASLEPEWRGTSSQ